MSKTLKGMKKQDWQNLCESKGIDFQEDDSIRTLTEKLAGEYGISFNSKTKDAILKEKVYNASQDGEEAPEATLENLEKALKAKDFHAAKAVYDAIDEDNLVPEGASDDEAEAIISKYEDLADKYEEATKGFEFKSEAEIANIQAQGNAVVVAEAKSEEEVIATAVSCLAEAKKAKAEGQFETAKDKLEECLAVDPKNLSGTGADAQAIKAEVDAIVNPAGEAPVLRAAETPKYFTDLQDAIKNAQKIAAEAREEARKAGRPNQRFIKVDADLRKILRTTLK